MSRTGPVVKSGEVLWFEVEDGIRLAVVDCPFCRDSHKYVLPVDVLAEAPLERVAKCDGRRGDVRIVLPDGGAPVVGS